MKIGFFINSRATHGAICAYELCQELTRLGHDTKIYAPSFDEHAPASVQRLLLSGEAVETVDWWTREGVECVLVYGPSNVPSEVLQSARAASVTIVYECDSDGYLSFAQSPLRVLTRRLWDSRYSLLLKARLLKGWLVLLIRRLAIQKCDVSALESADIIKIESRGPADILTRFLRSLGRVDLARKVTVVPFAVREPFYAAPVEAIRENLVVAAGRLGSQQKNPLLLAKVLRRYVTESPNARVELHIRGRASELEALPEHHPQIAIFHNSSSEMMAERLGRARVFLSASRWETTPIIGLEALCMGCTLVAPFDLPGYQSLIGGGEFGRDFPRRSVREAVRALQAEMAAWSTGQRNPGRTASYWRKHCALPAVARHWLELLSGHRAERGERAQPLRCSNTAFTS